MFENKFMGFGGFHGDFNNIARASDRRPFPQNLDTNPFMKNHECYSQSKDGGLDLCKKLNEMGISCDKSIWSKPEDFGSRHGWFHNNLPCRIPDGFRNLSSSHGVGVSPVKLRLLASQDYGFEEMMALKNHRDFLAIKRLFEEDRALAAMEGRSYAEDSRLRGVSLGTDALMFEGKTVSRALAAMEASGCSYTKKSTSSLPPNLACMVNIYGSVSLMAKDQIGCRALQKLVEEGTFHDFNAIFRGIINHLIHVSMDQFGNYLVQKMIDLCDEEQRTLILSVLTSKPLDLIQICLNNYGYARLFILSNFLSINFKRR